MQMTEINLKNWEDFEEQLRALKNSTARPENLLFRGQADASWPLHTTLERGGKFNPCVIDYYKIINIIKPEVETFMGTQWDLPDYDTQTKFWQNSGSLRNLSFLGDLPGYIYMIYLRHHGFPSPLLDWSRSPYVAAYFAFAKSSPKNSAIYVYSEMSVSGKAHSSRQPAIYSFGPTVRGHKRHFLQQSQYTLCLKFHQDLGNGQKEWHFAQHDDVVADPEETDQDIIIKFVLPSTERVKILKLLGYFNLNAFSLFGSEDSLMDTLATREFDFSS